MRPSHLICLFFASLTAAVAPAMADYVVRVPADDQRIASSPPPTPLVTLTSPVFGTQPVNTAVSRAATLSNGKATPIAVGAPSVTGTGFSVASTTCGASLAAGQSCTISVDLSAMAAGSYAGSLVIPAGGSNRSAALTATRSSPVNSVSFSPYPIEIGRVVYGGYGERTITVTNNGNTTLGNVTAVANTTISIPAKTCSGVTLAPGDSCTFTARFTPWNYGYYGGTGSITTTGGNFPFYTAEAGVGNAVSGVSITDVDFGWFTATPVDQTVTLTNSRGTSITVNTPSISGTSGWSIVGNSCGASLAAGQSCTFTVRQSSLNSLSYAVLSVGTSAGSMYSWLSARTVQP